MVYTLQGGVQKTLGDRLWKSLEYGVVGVGAMLLALFIGNVWYASRISPVTTGSGGTSHPRGRVVQMNRVAATESADASTGSGKRSDQPQPVRVAPAAPAAPAPNTTDQTIVPIVNSGPIVVTTDPVTVPTVPISTDDGNTVPPVVGSGGDGSGDTGVPPIDVNLPLVDVTTPGLSVGL